jgi:hypothetical protein
MSAFDAVEAPPSGLKISCRLLASKSPSLKIIEN